MGTGPSASVGFAAFCCPEDEEHLDVGSVSGGRGQGQVPCPACSKEASKQASEKAGKPQRRIVRYTVASNNTEFSIGRTHTAGWVQLCATKALAAAALRAETARRLLQKVAQITTPPQQQPGPAPRPTAQAAPLPQGGKYGGGAWVRGDGGRGWRKGRLQV